MVAGDGTFRTGSVVVCADAWTNELLAPLGHQLPLDVTREQVAYYPSDTLADFAIGRFPVWIWMDEPCFYGFPVYGDLGAVKAAEDCRRAADDGRRPARSTPTTRRWRG